MKKNINLIIVGIVVGVLFAVLIFSINPSLIGGSVFGGREVSFKVSDVHLKTSVDFAGGEIPSYSEDFCKVKYNGLYDKTARACRIVSVQVVARTNPLVKDIYCSCR